MNEKSGPLGVHYIGTQLRTNMEVCYALVQNIPHSYHSKDLRQFFSSFVEESRFICFHFRHRPEIAKETTDTTKHEKGRTTYCCIVALTSKNREFFIKRYHGTPWKDSGNSKSLGFCLIGRVTLPRAPSKQNIESDLDQTNSSNAEFIELKPPALMFAGNVGTSTKHFLELIKQCKLPVSVIKKLGLTFLRSGQGRIYSRVPPLAVETVYSDELYQDYYADETPEAESGRNGIEDEEEVEEWDRHETLHDDVTSQERTKERLYEEELEVTWEKGGPGMVLYTDACYWRKVDEGDFDEETVDDWDVDMSVYEGDPNGGDKDARDFLQMRHERLSSESKLNESCFSKKRKTEFQNLARKHPASSHSELAGNSNASLHFEKHTKGIGQKIMLRSGWKPGFGLGKLSTGEVRPVADIVDSTRKPSNKQGLGYYGETLQRTNLINPPVKHSITTKYDKVSVTDPMESLLERSEPSSLAHVC